MLTSPHSLLHAKSSLLPALCSPLSAQRSMLHALCSLDIKNISDTLNIMKTANVADLRNNFSQISNWILAGEEVLIKRRGKIFAKLTPPHHSEVKVPPAVLDRHARLKKIYSEPVKGDLQSIISEQRD